MEPTGRGVPGERRDESSAVKSILELFHRQGDSRYGGEAVTQREHALQAATFAERQGADSALITFVVSTPIVSLAMYLSLATTRSPL